MTDLLNAVETPVTLVEYDRAGLVELRNPLDGPPSATFHMGRATIVKETGEVQKFTPTVDLVVGYDPAAVYPMFNPVTGAPIPGASFTADQFYAMVYSIMRSAQ